MFSVKHFAGLVVLNAETGFFEKER